MQSEPLSDGMEGLNSEEVTKMDGEKRTLLHAFPRLYLRELSWALAWPAYLLRAFIHELTDWQRFNRPGLLPPGMPSLPF